MLILLGLGSKEKRWTFLLTGKRVTFAAWLLHIRMIDHARLGRDYDEL